VNLTGKAEIDFSVLRLSQWVVLHRLQDDQYNGTYPPEPKESKAEAMLFLWHACDSAGIMLTDALKTGRTESTDLAREALVFLSTLNAQATRVVASGHADASRALPEAMIRMSARMDAIFGEDRAKSVINEDVLREENAVLHELLAELCCEDAELFADRM